MTGNELDVRGVRAIMIFTSDPVSSSRWWARILGLPVQAEGEFHWLDLPCGVELGFHPADEGKNPQGASTVTYLQVDSVDHALDRIVSAGGRCHRGPLTVASGRRIAQVCDPFGTVIGLDGP